MSSEPHTLDAVLGASFLNVVIALTWAGYPEAVTSAPG